MIKRAAHRRVLLHPGLVDHLVIDDKLSIPARQIVRLLRRFLGVLTRFAFTVFSRFTSEVLSFEIVDLSLVSAWIKYVEEVRKDDKRLVPRMP